MKKILPNKILLLVGGYPGAGKTHLSKEILKKVIFVYLDKDAIQDIFSNKRLNDKAKQAKPFVYNIIYKITEKNLENCQSVLIDAPFSLKRYMANKEWVNMIKQLAKNNQAQIKVIWCIASNKTRKERIKKRKAGRDKERYDDLDGFIQIDKYIGPEEKFPIPFDHLIFHTEKDPLSKAIDFLFN